MRTRGAGEEALIGKDQAAGHPPMPLPQPGLFIANGVDDQPSAMPVAPMPLPPPGSNAPPPPVHSGPAYWIKVSAQEDGTFTVTNARNGFSKVYRRGVQGTPRNQRND